MKRASRFEENIEMGGVKRYARPNKYLAIVRKLKTRRSRVKTWFHKYLIKRKSKN